MNRKQFSRRPAPLRGFLLGSIAAAFACAAPDAPTSPLGSPVAASSVAASSYIVVLAKGSNPTAVAASVGVSPRFTYRAALNGFAADLTDAAVEALERNPNVAYIEPVATITLDPTVAALESRIWGLDRINQRGIATAGDFNLAMPNDGSGVHAYIIDTGIRATHTEFGGRVVYSHDAALNQPDLVGDCNGHGTHVAGTVGGATYGVAKQVRLVSVRVFNSFFGSEIGTECYGSTTTDIILAGIEWVTANAIKPAVANLSLGTGIVVQSMNDAVAASIASGITYAIAAGNSHADACTTSPASVPAALTVGASNIQDQMAYFSNSGPCLDLFAPGEVILSAYWLTDSDVELLSGTSMASPHVAGVAALYLHSNPAASPAEVSSAIINSATAGALTDQTSSYPSLPGTPNKLLYADWTGATTPPPPPPPADNAGFSKSCSGYACTFVAVSSGSWTFGDGGVGSGIQVSHTFAPKRSYTVTHTVGSVTATASVNCKPKGRCQ
jgi:subtilisin family serine protease